MMVSIRSGIGATVVSRHGKVLLGGVRTLKSPAYRRMMQKKAKSAGPSLVDAKTMPNGMSELDNESLVSLAAMKNQKARIEVLKRHIMSVDNVSYETACNKFKEIQTSNHKDMPWASLPYLTGMVVASTAGLASLPLCFYFPLVANFNEKYVTYDVPEAKDLETWLEVGSWAWNWMEPPLGSLSFMLLCLQFSRAQMVNLGIRPFTSFLKDRRAEHLCSAFPMYDKRILSEFSKTDPLMGFGN